jgi:hypothetical protein
VNLFTSSSEQFSRTFLFLFFVVIALFMTMTEVVFRLRVAESHPFEHYKEMYSSQLAEVVMFGDSHVANGILATDEVLNLGYAGNNMNAMTTKVFDYIKKNDVEYIGLQADPHLFSYYRIVKDQSEHLDSLLNKNETMLIMFKPHLRKYLLNYWKSWLSDPGKIFFPDREKKNTNSEKEVYSIIEVDKKVREKQASIRVQLHRPISSFEKSETAMQLSNAIQKLLDLDKQVCLITYPVSSDYRRASKAYEKFSEAIDFYKTLSKSKNIKYVNYGDRYEDDYFGDVDHLNLNGREKFTREVVRECFGDLT